MDRKKYTDCMIPYMRGGGPDRKERFCIGAKICSGKSSNEQDAARLCAEAAANPKEPKQRKTKGKCKIDTNAVAVCIISALNGSDPTRTNLAPIIASCTGQKVGKPNTRENFIKKCFKENMVTGDMKEAQKLRTMCTAQWKEQEASL